MAGKPKLFATKEELIQLYDEGKTAKEIAELYSVGINTVYSLRKRYGIASIGSQGARKHNLNHRYFEQIDTPEKAYWLGFLMADGGIYRGTDEYSYRLQINLKASDIEQLEKFQAAIGSSYKIQVKKVKDSEVCILKVNSTQMCKDLISHGLILRKSEVCEFPYVPFPRDFVRGYFDGDGCIKRSKAGYSFSIVGGSVMLEEIQTYLPAKTQLYRIKGRTVVSIETAAKESVIKIMNWMYETSDETTRLERKYKLYMSFLSELRESP